MTSNTRSAWKNPSYLQSSFGIFMFFCSWGIWWSFFSRWLTDPTHGLGMTSAEQGQIYSINSLATLVIMFAYGAIQDQLGIKRKLVIFVSAIAALVGPFVQFVYAPMLTAGGTTRFIGVLIGSIVLSSGFMAGCSLFEALTERYSRKFGFEYGQSRAWGSFGYAIVALCAGFVKYVLLYGCIHVGIHLSGIHVERISRNRSYIQTLIRQDTFAQPVGHA